MSSALDELLLAETKGRRATNAETQRGTIDAPERLQRQAQRVNTFVDPGGPNVDRAGISQLTSGLEKFSGGFRRGADAVVKEWSKRETESALADFSASGKNTLAEYEQSLSEGDDPVTLGRVARNALERVSGVRQGQEAAAGILAQIEAGEFNGLSPVEFKDVMNESFAEAINEVPQGEQFYFSTIQAEEEARLAAIQVATSNADTAQKTITMVVEDSNDGNGEWDPESLVALEETIGLQGFQASGDQLLAAIVSRDAALAAERGVPYLSVGEGLADAEAEVAGLMEAAGYEWEPSSAVEDQVLGSLAQSLTRSEAGGNLRDQVALKEAQDAYALNPTLSFSQLRNLHPEARPWDLRKLMSEGEKTIDPVAQFEEDAKRGRVSTDPSVVASISFNSVPEFSESNMIPLPTLFQNAVDDAAASKDPRGAGWIIKNLQAIGSVGGRDAFLTAVRNSDPAGYNEFAKLNAWSNMSPEQQVLLAQQQQDWEAYSGSLRMEKKGYGLDDPNALKDSAMLVKSLTDDEFDPSIDNFLLKWARPNDAERTEQFAQSVVKRLDSFEGPYKKEEEQRYLYGLQKQLVTMQKNITVPESLDQQDDAMVFVESLLQERELPLDGLWLGPFNNVDNMLTAPLSEDSESNVATMEDAETAQGVVKTLHTRAIELNDKAPAPTDFFDYFFPYGGSIDVPDFMQRENRLERGNTWTRLGNSHIMELNPDLNYWPQGEPEDAEEAVPLTEAGAYDLSGTMMGRLIQRTSDVVGFLRSPVDTTADAIRPAYMENKPSRN